jgi:hypothetical protein
VEGRRSKRLFIKPRAGFNAADAAAFAGDTRAGACVRRRILQDASPTRPPQNIGIAGIFRYIELQ